MRVSNRPISPWRAIAIAASLGGFLILVLWLQGIDHLQLRYLTLCSIPIIVGLVAGLGNMETRTRILFLWLAAAISGFVAIITIMSGAGLILLGAMLAYLVIAWMMNEASENRTDPD